MATPSSSATSPSPPMAYLPANPHHTHAPLLDRNDNEARKKAVSKFLARAELSSVTRSLRTRLSYASYKAAHNIPHSSLHDLELQTQTSGPSAQVSRTIAAKRKVQGSNNHYNNPATQGAGSFSATAHSARKPGLGNMAPPHTSGARSHYPAGPSGSGSSSSVIQFHDQSRPFNASQSLFTSILAPPPSKQARTILNASDPPVPAPERPAPSSRTGGGKVAKSIAEGTRGHAKGRSTKKASGSDRRKGKASSDKKHRSHVDADGDVDMKAAATLTSLLLNKRPSIAGTSSPRSSADNLSEVSAPSFQHYAPPHPTAVRHPGPSSSAVPSGPSFRNMTPPPGSSVSVQQPPTSTTPRPAPTDNEAADLMLFLATSPSPARGSNKDANDLAAYRVLGGGAPGGPNPLLVSGRVLFPSASAPDLGDNDGNHTGRGTSSHSRDGAKTSQVDSLPIPPGHLLPPPVIPSSASSQGSPGYRMISDRQPHSFNAPISQVQTVNPPSRPSQTAGDNPHGSATGFSGPRYPSPTASSPSRGSHFVPPPQHAQQVHQPKGGLRADVGRKLYQEEQIRLGAGGFGAGGDGSDPARGASSDPMMT